MVLFFRCSNISFKTTMYLLAKKKLKKLQKKKTEHSIWTSTYNDNLRTWKTENKLSSSDSIEIKFEILLSIWYLIIFIFQLLSFGFPSFFFCVFFYYSKFYWLGQIATNFIRRKSWFFIFILNIFQTDIICKIVSKLFDMENRLTAITFI